MSLLPCVQATLSLSPFLVQKLNKLGSDLYGANGQQNAPRTTADFIERLKSIIACELPHKRLALRSFLLAKWIPHAQQ